MTVIDRWSLEQIWLYQEMDYSSERQEEEEIDFVE
jgi:hypothetical protein